VVDAHVYPAMANHWCAKMIDLPFADVHHCPELSILQLSFFFVFMLLAFSSRGGILDVVSISETFPAPHFRYRRDPTKGQFTPRRDVHSDLLNALSS
jgi:hypothetical protein